MLRKSSVHVSRIGLDDKLDPKILFRQFELAGNECASLSKFWFCLFRSTPIREYLLLKRAAEGYWQGVAGGVNDSESNQDAALRESFEETGAISTNLVLLDSHCTIPVDFVTGFLWGPSVLLVTEYAFGLEVNDAFDVVLSDEHSEFRWSTYEEAIDVLKWDSNKNALWELNHRLRLEPS